MSSASSPTVLAVHAHPDDECILTGGALARYASEGCRVVLVTCTDGAVGEIHADTGGRDLAAVRAEELAAACTVLGVTGHHFLGYRDSGMAGTPDNAHPDCFVRADLEEATGRLLRIFEDERPDVVVTYDERGGYGHPDHVRAHEVCVEAYRRSAGAPWAPRKLYFASIPRSAMQQFVERLREHEIDGPGGDGDDDDGGDFEMGEPDERFTTLVDVSAQYDAKREALRCHATQLPRDSWFFAIPDDLARLAFGQEWYILADARVPVGPHEDSLLSGL